MKVVRQLQKGGYVISLVCKSIKIALIRLEHKMQFPRGQGKQCEEMWAKVKELGRRQEQDSEVATNGQVLYASKGQKKGYRMLSQKQIIDV